MGQRTLALILGLAVTAGAATVRVGWREPGGRRSIQTLDLEDYTAAALNGEAGVFTSPAALEAMAITIRTFARVNAGATVPRAPISVTLPIASACSAALRPRASAPLSKRARADSMGSRASAEVFFHRNCGA